MWGYALMPKILNVSLTASAVILVVLAVRLLLKKSPRIFGYVLWGVVMLRLLCLVSVSSPASYLGGLDRAAAVADTEAEQETEHWTESSEGPGEENEAAPTEALNGTYGISVRSISESSRCIENYVETEELDMGPIPFADACVFRVNKSMSGVDYEEVSFASFAEYIAEGEPNQNKPCILTLSEGEVTEICLESAYYRYGITYIDFAEYLDYFDEYKAQQEAAGESLLEEYYTLDYSVQTDVADRQGLETIEVYTGNTGDGKSGYVFVKDEDGTILYNIFAHTVRAGWKSIYLGENSSGNFLLVVTIEDREDYGAYSYLVFRCGEDGKREQIAGSSFEFGFPYVYEDALFRQWAEEMEGWLKDSTLLLSSQNGVIRTEHVSEADKYNYETLKR